jgi:hypothetical protein
MIIEWDEGGAQVCRAVAAGPRRPEWWNGEMLISKRSSAFLIVEEFILV